MTPPVQVFASVNTVSDLTWVQCEPCIKYYKQAGLPFLVPASSSTYQTQSCLSKTCEALEGDNLTCILRQNAGFGST
ncbi:putative nepenthesin [Helianthus annuus]|nr:putative nepenthesin [Helianthus annuus]